MVRCASSSTPSPSSSAAEAGQQVVKVHSYGTVDYERRTALRWSSLYRRIAVGHGDLPVGRTLGAWDEGERRLDKWELCRIARELRKFRRFNLALQRYKALAPWRFQPGFVRRQVKHAAAAPSGSGGVLVSVSDMKGCGLGVVTDPEFYKGCDLDVLDLSKKVVIQTQFHCEMRQL